MTIDVMMIGLRSIGGGQGGIEKHVACLVEEFDKLGLKTCVVVRTAYATGDPVQLGRTSWTKSIWAPRQVAVEAIAHSLLATLYAGIKRPKVLHIHAVGPSLMAPLARLLGLKVVCTHHGQDYDREKWGLLAKTALRLGERCQAQFADARICVSRSLSVQLTERYGKSFEFIPNAVSPMPVSKDFSTLGSFGLVPGAYIVHVGRIVPEKRQTDLIAAFAALKRPDLKLVLVGAADHSSAYADSVLKAAEATPGVVMAGFQKGDALAQLIGGAAVFALPSTHEGMPIAALEAMSLGRPLAISDIAPNFDLALPRHCYHEAGSIQSLGSCLAEALDRHAGEELPYYNWDEYLTAYKWSTVAQSTANAYGLDLLAPVIDSQ